MYIQICIEEVLSLLPAQLPSPHPRWALLRDSGTQPPDTKAFTPWRIATIGDFNGDRAGNIMVMCDAFLDKRKFSRRIKVFAVPTPMHGWFPNIAKSPFSVSKYHFYSNSGHSIVKKISSGDKEIHHLLDVHSTFFCGPGHQVASGSA